MLKPIKRLGQNFLQDPNTIRKIVECLEADSRDIVVEIGPGTGALTGPLSLKYQNLYTLEIDTRAVELLLGKFPEVNTIHGDVLDFDWAALAEKHSVDKISVIGNLPYYITSQILFALLEAAPRIREAVIMMQYEVAERLVALPRSKQYGILSVATQLACRPQILFPVSRNVFYPRPDVRSAIVRLIFDVEGSEKTDHAAVRKIIRAAFNQRRKTLRNSLSSVVEETGRALPEAVAGKRAEELSPEDFVELAQYLLDGVSPRT